MSYFESCFDHHTLNSIPRKSFSSSFVAPVVSSDTAGSLLAITILTTERNASTKVMFVSALYYIIKYNKFNFLENWKHGSRRINT